MLHRYGTPRSVHLDKWKSVSSVVLTVLVRHILFRFDSYGTRNLGRYTPNFRTQRINSSPNEKSIQ